MEQRLIDANPIFDKVEANYRMSEGVQHKCEREFLNLICDAPTIDAVPVVRCKDCKWFKSGIDIDGKPFTKCIGANGSVRTYGHTAPDWFCADGERRTDGEQ